jgi:hypothetical protein
VDLLKWGLGIFATVAIAFAGFNSWNANRNYERDKEAFEKQFLLLAQQFSTNHNNELTQLRDATENSLLSLTNSLASISEELQKQFNMLRESYFENFSNAWVIMIRSNVYGMLLVASNNDFRFNALVTNVNVTLSNRDVNFGHNIDTALRSVQTNVAENMSMALGQSLMLKGSITGGKPKQPRGNALASAAHSYIGACRNLYEGHDEVNLQRCLRLLGGTCLPQLVNKTSKAQLMLLVTEYELANELKLLIAELKAGNVNGRYNDSMTTFQMYLQVFEGKLPAK